MLERKVKVLFEFGSQAIKVDLLQQFCGELA